MTSRQSDRAKSNGQFLHHVARITSHENKSFGKPHCEKQVARNMSHENRSALQPSVIVRRGLQKHPFAFENHDPTASGNNARRKKKLHRFKDSNF
jgi:hypothetical protein